VKPKVQPAEIRLADSGIASAYVVLPLGVLREEMSELRSLRLKEPRLKKTKTGTFYRDERNVEAQAIAHLTGQADILAQYEVTDFRDILSVDYPTSKSHAQVLNWIFSVPCFRVEGKGGSLRFTMHLRLRRTTYAFNPARDEQCVVGYLRDRLQAAQCSATIHAGLGWADFIVDGTFDPEQMEAFVTYLVDVHRGCIQSSSDLNQRTSVFVRTLTLIGYPWPLNDKDDVLVPDLPNVTPVTFVRAAPGGIDQAVLDVMADNRKAEIRYIDGKSDFVVVSDVEPDLLERNLRIGDNGSGKPSRKIQRLETHLVYWKRRSDEVTSESRRRVEVFEAEAQSPENCRCHTRKLGRKLSKELPREIAQSVSNALFLSDSTLRDEMTCCDVVQALEAADRALEVLSNSLDERHRARAAADREHQRCVDANDDDGVAETLNPIMRIHRQINDNLHHVELWHLFVERVLRQRTVASFEEMLLRSDRNVVYRGSVQKFLFLADALMYDFLTKVSRRRHDGPRLWAMYDSITRIFSTPAMGLVRIPARHLFRLPSILPDLWHEVGVYIFYSEVAQEELEKIDESGNRVPVSVADYQTLGDRYGDLTVLHIGFDASWQRFLVSQVRAWLDAYDVRKISRALYLREYVALLIRLVFARAVSSFRDPKRFPPPPDEEEEATELIRVIDFEIGRIFKPIPGKRHNIPRVPEQILRDAGRRVFSEINQFGEILYEWFSDTVDLSVVGMSPLEKYREIVETADGRLRELGTKDDLNALLGELYWHFRLPIVEKNMSLERPFQRMATVVRSAIIEYHRRRVKFSA
jgi:hypothetical protein